LGVYLAVRPRQVCQEPWGGALKDWLWVRVIAASLAIIAFNVPIVFALLGLRSAQGFDGVVREKDVTGISTGDISYSRTRVKIWSSGTLQARRAVAILTAA